jgi:hypothetical protein
LQPVSEAPEVTGLRGELKELKLRVDALEVRIAAAELKQKLDHDSLEAKWNDIVSGIAALSRTVANLSSQQMASHYSLVHLLAVTARQMKVPDADLNEAMRMATEAMKGAT